MDLKKKIQSYGHTLAEVGNAINVSKSGMTSLVKGNPQYLTLEKIANYIGISVSELVSDEELPKPLKCPHCGKTITVTLS